MKKDVFYLDTCIWLNLFKKEGDSRKGRPYWKIAGDFIECVKKNNKKILVSSFIVKEISFKAKDIFQIINAFFQEEKYICMISVKKEDYLCARKLESESNFKISFYDCLHVVLSKRLNALLVTRDRKLIDFAQAYVETIRPEDLLY